MTSKAPERIWTQPDMKGFCITGVWPHQPSEQRNMTEYTRADALAAAQEEIERLTAELDELDFLRHEGGPDSVAGLETRVKALEAENERLRKVLAFYADGEWPEDYPGGVLYDPNGHYEKTYIDYGDKARAALGKEGT